MYEYINDTLTNTCLTLHDVTVMTFSFIFFLFSASVIYVMGTLIYDARSEQHFERFHGLSTDYEGLTKNPTPNIRRNPEDFKK